MEGMGGGGDGTGGDGTGGDGKRGMGKEGMVEEEGPIPLTMLSYKFQFEDAP